MQRRELLLAATLQHDLSDVHIEFLISAGALVQPPKSFSHCPSRYLLLLALAPNSRGGMVPILPSEHRSRILLSSRHLISTAFRLFLPS